MRVSLKEYKGKRNFKVTPEPSGTDASEFTLYGKKLNGFWVLAWLLIKHGDQYASERDTMVKEPYSILTRRLLANIARGGGGGVNKAASGDPPVERGTRAVPGKAALAKARKRRR